MPLEAGDRQLPTSVPGSGNHALDEVHSTWMQQYQNLYDPARAFVLGAVGAAVGEASAMPEVGSRAGLGGNAFSISGPSPAEFRGALKGLGTGLGVVAAESFLDYKLFPNTPLKSWTLTTDIMGGLALFTAPYNRALTAAAVVAVHEAARYLDSKSS